MAAVAAVTGAQIVGFIWRRESGEKVSFSGTILEAAVGA